MIKKITPSLGLSREDLPQILDRKDFVDWIRSQGLAVSYVPVRFNTLTASQNEYDSEKVDRLKESSLAYIVGKPLICSRDSFVLDGHHRWLAAAQLNPDVVGWMFRVDCDFYELLRLVKEYSGAITRKVTEGWNRPSREGDPS